MGNEVEPDTAGALVCLPPTVSGSTIELGYRGERDGRVSRFTETIELPAELRETAMPLEPVLRLLSLAASLSYYKAFAPGSIEVTFGLTPQERSFISRLTSNGLGEFAFMNDLPQVLDTEILGQPIHAEPVHAEPIGLLSPTTLKRALVAIGGGKDSIVSMEALRSAGVEVGLFSVNSYGPIQETAAVAGLPLIVARRHLDPELFRLNESGAPNGHVPVTAVNSIIAVLSAMALGYDTVVFSNEASSSYGNFTWHGRQINHQWSKGIAFERLLRESLPAASPNYVSLLRPLTELRIAKRFAQHKQFHGVFTSCNRAYKLRENERSSWCADCAKCRFVFLSLAPFMSRAELLTIFGGRDMFADENQIDGFLELLGAEGLHKPLECVGEPDECRGALTMLMEHGDWQGHPFLRSPKLHGMTLATDDLTALFAFRDTEHFLTPQLEAVARAI